MDLVDALSWAADRNHGVLITIRRDGRPQSSDIIYLLDRDSFLISMTDGRAKTRNLRRDPRCVLHLTHPEGWAYVSFDGTAEVSPVAADPADETCDRLVEHYRAVAGEHDDWDEYRRSMVEDQRLLVRFIPTAAVGQIPGG